MKSKIIIMIAWVALIIWITPMFAAGNKSQSLPPVDELPSIPCPNEIDGAVCPDDECKARHLVLPIRSNKERKFWQIQLGEYFSFDHAGKEWLLIYPNRDNEFDPVDAHIEVHAEPVVTKMKDGWFRITFKDGAE